mgnify:CR=1 FL=1
MTVPAAPSAVEPFDAVDVIAAKRDGAALTDAQIDWVMDAYTRGVVAEEQMSALAMAIYLRGMSRAEITRWTGAMIASGERMDFSGLGRPTADKHSTGGVGDKITLPLAPLVAVFGVSVPQLSGRGLGHTGGTLDKMESIPRWRIQSGLAFFPVLRYPVKISLSVWIIIKRSLVMPTMPAGIGVHSVIHGIFSLFTCWFKMYWD